MTFNPNEARDDSGKWTAGAGNGAHALGPFMAISDAANAEKANTVAQIAAAVAKKLDFDPTKINISDESKTFELNGKTMFYAGWATRPQEPKLVVDPDGSKQITGGGIGTVTLFTPHIGNDPEGIAGVAAHEIAHQRYNAFLSDYRTDMLKLSSDPDYNKNYTWAIYDPTNPAHEALVKSGAVVSSPNDDGTRQIREPAFMNPDGLLNEPYASKYPAYQAYTKAMMPMIEKFAKSDGVSDYSKQYWLGYQTPLEGSFINPKGVEQKYTTTSIPLESAFHETLAEITRLKFSGDPIYHRKLGEVDGKPVYFATSTKGLKPEWSALYKAINENWKRRNK